MDLIELIMFAGGCLYIGAVAAGWR